MLPADQSPGFLRHPLRLIRTVVVARVFLFIGDENSSSPDRGRLLEGGKHQQNASSCGASSTACSPIFTTHYCCGEALCILNWGAICSCWRYLFSKALVVLVTLWVSAIGYIRRHRFLQAGSNNDFHPFSNGMLCWIWNSHKGVAFSTRDIHIHISEEYFQ